MRASPTSAPPAINQVELIRNRSKETSDAAAMAIASGSTSEAQPIWIVTAAIRPNAAAFTPSNSPLSYGERRSRGMKGFESATKTKEGKKMPSVASSAAGRPPRV